MFAGPFGDRSHDYGWHNGLSPCQLKKMNVVARLRLNIHVIHVNGFLHVVTASNCWPLIGCLTFNWLPDNIVVNPPLKIESKHPGGDALFVAEGGCVSSFCGMARVLPV